MSRSAFCTLVWSIVLIAVVACDEGASGPPLNGELGRVDGVDVLWLWGSPEEMGYAEGALLCGRITRVLEELFLTHSEELGVLGYDSGIDLIRQVAAVPPERERQLQAMVEGMQARCPAADLRVDMVELPGGPREITYEDLLLFNYYGVLQDLMACSSLTVWGEASATGVTLHARNVDLIGGFEATTLEETMVKVYRSDGPQVHLWTSISLPGRVGCASCFDERGAGVTNHKADRSALPSAEATGLSSITDASQEALLAAGSAVDPLAAADAVYDALPRRGGNNLHLFLPCPGAACPGAAVFENDGDATHPDGRATVRRPGEVTDGLDTDAAIVTTNHFVKRVDPGSASAGSAARYEILVTGINQALPTGGLDVQGALLLMAAVSAPDIAPPTYYTTILDTSSMTLYLYLAADTDDDAPLQVPQVLSLEGLFAAIPR